MEAVFKGSFSVTSEPQKSSSYPERRSHNGTIHIPGWAPEAHPKPDGADEHTEFRSVGWKMCNLEDAVISLEQGGPLGKDEDLLQILHKCRKDKNRSLALRLYAYMEKYSLDCHPIFGNPLVSMLADGGSVSLANAVFDRLEYRRECSWSSLITGYIRLGDPYTALTLYDKMQEDSSVQPSQTTVVAAFKACAKLKDNDRGRKLHAYITTRNFLLKDAFVCSALVSMYCKCGYLTEASAVFDKLSVHDVVSWTTLIAGYVQEGNCEEALKCLDLMQLEGVSPDGFTYACSLKACGGLGAIQKGQDIHANITKIGKFEKDPLVLASMVDMYAKCGLLLEAQKAFDIIYVRNIDVWYALIAGYSLHGHHEEVLNCFREMQREGISPNAAILVCALKACGNIQNPHKGQAIHAEISRTASFENEGYVGTALVDMYVKCGLLAQAQQAFNKLLVQDVISWTALIAGYARHGHAKEALEHYEQMQCEGIIPNAVTYVCSLSACASLGDLEKGLEIHAKIKERHLGNDLLLGTALVDMYAKCGLPNEARKIFDQLGVHDVVAWNALISGYEEQGCSEEALCCFDQMLSEPIFPDATTYILSLKACTSIGAIHKGMELETEICAKCLKTDHFVGSALVDMHAKCGFLAKAQEVHNRLAVQDVVSWNALIAGYAQHGEMIDVLRILDKMMAEGIKPVAATFSSIFNAYTHSGMVDRSQLCLEAMIDHYGIPMTLEHLTCIIDLLGRVGQLHEAVAIIDTMSFCADYVVWHTVLGACQKWGNLGFGKQAFELVVQTNQKDDGAFVSMHNIFSDVGLTE